jgi:hypothetical protein
MLYAARLEANYTQLFLVVVYSLAALSVISGRARIGSDTCALNPRGAHSLALGIGLDQESGPNQALGHKMFWVGPDSAGWSL